MTLNDQKRLIEVAFPLKQVSLDSVHEKNVHHGHISTLHIWPARRPLAASRAALIATLLPDPSDAEERKDILERMAGRVTEKVERKRVNGRIVEKVKEETTGGILHWGRENGPDLEGFRIQIREAYGGRAPKVLDPFAGGGAIPLEAMRLGCEVTAMDINPVAWFILKCTLEYPQKLAGQTRPLPDFAQADREFMEAFLKAKGFKGARLRTFLERLGHGEGEGTQLGELSEYDSLVEADLAWHVRAWGRWVLARARRELASYYPTYAEFQPLTPNGDAEQRPMRLLELDDDGIVQPEPLNAEFNESYLKDPHNPRWVAKPTVAYLWARTVSCKQCRATLPLLKTRWLCKKDNKRVLLNMEPNSDQTGVNFAVEDNVPQHGGNTAQRREHDKRFGAGTMSRTGATCPCCGAIMTMEDIRLEGQRERLGVQLIVVVTNGPAGKGYRAAEIQENEAAIIGAATLSSAFEQTKGDVPTYPLVPASTRSISCQKYGLDTYSKLLSDRQQLFVATIARFVQSILNLNDEETQASLWDEAIAFSLLCVLDKAIDYGNTLASWYTQNEQITHLFNRYALPMKWDFAETAPFGGASGSWQSMLTSVAKSIEGTCGGLNGRLLTPDIICGSSTDIGEDQRYDVVITDPPYYQAISYGDLSDFFYVWLRLVLAGRYDVFRAYVTDKSCEIVQHIRADKDRAEEAKKYEKWMSDSFQAIANALRDDGRFVVVFAHKEPNAWEALVGAIIKAGFIVNGSWPVQTEMPNRSRGFGQAALSSSVWLVCRKRPPGKLGWDNDVLVEMRENITQKLRDFWDAGIRGPDFVWAATGPAMEAFSKHPVVKKANAPDEIMTVSEFLREVRRMVVDFVVGRVLTQGGEEAVTGLDDVTTYYLLHRNDFGLEDAPVGGCILYALSCNLSDSSLVNQHDLLAQSKNGPTADSLDDDASEDDEGEDDSGGGAKVKLKPWHRRRGRSLGLESPGGRPAPLIDQVHKLMHLWRAGDQARVNEYLDSRGLQRNALFHKLLQALIELSPAGTDERSILEALSNHATAHGDVRAPRYRQPRLGEAP